MDDDLVFIPSNYTDAGKVFGVFEIRNTIEGLIFCIPLSLLLVNLCSGFSLSLTATALIVSAAVIPTGGLCLSGIYGYSLLTFLRIYFLWRFQKGSSPTASFQNKKERECIFHANQRKRNQPEKSHFWKSV